MEIGTTISHPLMRVVVGVGEATIREACGQAPGLRIHVEMDQFVDGREGVRVTMRAPGSLAGFFIGLRKYFDQDALWRAARRAWVGRVPCAEAERELMRGVMQGIHLN